MLKQLAQLKEHSDIKILAASPEANSFFNAGRVKEKIPLFYRYNVISWLKLFKDVYEYQKLGWTYHAKGLSI
jgi:hypothetical protein